jgi:hypothetical protein
MNAQQKLSVLREYSAGHAGTRATIERVGLDDYADLVIALAANDLPFPKPPDTPALRRHRAKARELLLPRLTKRGLWDQHDPDVKDAVIAILEQSRKRAEE